MGVRAPVIELTLVPGVLVGALTFARSDEEMVLGRVAARQLNVEVEDKVVVVGAKGPLTFEITGFAVIPNVEGGDGIGGWRHHARGSSTARPRHCAEHGCRPAAVGGRRARQRGSAR